MVSPSLSDPMTRDTLDRFLRTLGETAEEVAATLERLGVKGTHHCKTCPISVAVWEHFKHPVSSGGGWVCSTEIDLLKVFAPEGVRVFIPRFDKGQYPNLEVSDERH